MSIEQQNSDYNLYSSAITVYNKTALVDSQWEFDIRIGDGTKNLHTNAATLTLKITVGAYTINGGSASTAKDSTVLRAALRTGTLYVAAGESVVITLQSNNSNDTDVDVTVIPRQVLDVDNIAGILLDLENGIETDQTLRQALRIVSAVIAGKVTGVGSGQETFLGLDGITPRVIASTDTEGNRINVTYAA